MVSTKRIVSAWERFRKIGLAGDLRRADETYKYIQQKGDQEIDMRVSVAMKKAEEAAEKDIDWARMERFRQQLKTPKAIEQWDKLCSQLRTDMLNAPKEIRQRGGCFSGHKEGFEQLFVAKSGWKKLVREWRRRTHALPRKVYPLLLLAGPALVFGCRFKESFQA